ncbi:MAG: glutamate--tRNA ligase [Chloroflexota bacterium]
MTDSKPVRVRFAPSPTGPMHIGGLRTAVFNWLFARHHNGSFILRIEDTDRSRYDAEAEKLIFSAMDWIGIDVDESTIHGGEFGPYRQSERLELYQKWAKWLVENDKAYYDFTTPQELEQINEAKKKRKEPPGYDRRHRNITEEERAKLKAEGRPEVIRFKMPLEGKTAVNDMIRGKIEFDNDSLQDNVLLKSDGFPTYHLANVVDDHYMEISHIMRANEWIASAPLHKQLYDAFGWDMPDIAHLPVLLNPNGKGKMSKRELQDDKGNVIPVLVHRYEELGFLPDAMMNFLSNIGWTFGDDVEVFTTQEAIKRFDGTRINPSNSAYPADKLRWYNGIYIREHTSTEALMEMVKPFLEKANLPVDEEKLRIITSAVQTRMETLTEFPEITRFIFTPEFTPASVEDHIQKKMDAESTLKALQIAYNALKNMEFDAVAMEGPMRQLAKDNGFKVGQLFGTLRTATAAQRIAPPLFDSFVALGKEETLRRIQLSIDQMTEATTEKQEN